MIREASAAVNGGSTKKNNNAIRNNNMIDLSKRHELKSSLKGLRNSLKRPSTYSLCDETDPELVETDYGNGPADDHSTTSSSSEDDNWSSSSSSSSSYIGSNPSNLTCDECDHSLVDEDIEETSTRSLKSNMDPTLEVLNSISGGGGMGDSSYLLQFYSSQYFREEEEDATNNNNADGQNNEQQSEGALPTLDENEEPLPSRKSKKSRRRKSKSPKRRKHKHKSRTRLSLPEESLELGSQDEMSLPKKHPRSKRNCFSAPHLFSTFKAKVANAATAQHTHQDERKSSDILDDEPDFHSARNLRKHKSKESRQHHKEEEGKEQQPSTSRERRKDLTKSLPPNVHQPSDEVESSQTQQRPTLHGLKHGHQMPKSLSNLFSSNPSTHQEPKGKEPSPSAPEMTVGGEKIGGRRSWLRTKKSSKSKLFASTSSNLDESRRESETEVDTLAQPRRSDEITDEKKEASIRTFVGELVESVRIEGAEAEEVKEKSFPSLSTESSADEVEVIATEDKHEEIIATQQKEAGPKPILSSQRRTPHSFHSLSSYSNKGSQSSSVSSSTKSISFHSTSSAENRFHTNSNFSSIDDAAENHFQHSMQRRNRSMKHVYSNDGQCDDESSNSESSRQASKESHHTESIPDDDVSVYHHIPNQWRRRQTRSMSMSHGSASTPSCDTLSTGASVDFQPNLNQRRPRKPRSQSLSVNTHTLNTASSHPYHETVQCEESLFLRNNGHHRKSRSQSLSFRSSHNTYGSVGNPYQESVDRDDNCSYTSSSSRRQKSRFSGNPNQESVDRDDNCSYTSSSCRRQKSRFSVNASDNISRSFRSHRDSGEQDNPETVEYYSRPKSSRRHRSRSNSISNNSAYSMNGSVGNHSSSSGRRDRHFRNDDSSHSRRSSGSYEVNPYSTRTRRNESTTLRASSRRDNRYHNAREQVNLGYEAYHKVPSTSGSSSGGGGSSSMLVSWEELDDAIYLGLHNSISEVNSSVVEKQVAIASDKHKQRKKLRNAADKNLLGSVVVVDEEARTPRTQPSDSARNVTGNITSNVDSLMTDDVLAAVITIQEQEEFLRSCSKEGSTHAKNSAKDTSKGPLKKEKQADKPWQCPTCTFINENGMFLVCAVCNSPKHNP